MAPKQEKNKPGTEHTGAGGLGALSDPTDITTIRSIVTQYLDSDASRESVESQAAGDQTEFVLLEVNTIEDGLRRAAGLLNLPVDEIAFTIQQHAVVENEQVLTPYCIRFEQKHLAGPIICQVSADRMQAIIRTVFPQDELGRWITVDILHQALLRDGIKSGVYEDVLRGLVDTLMQEKNVQHDILVAEGSLPQPGGQSTLSHSLIPAADYCTKPGAVTDLDCLYLSTVEEIRNAAVAAHYVRRGEIIAEVARAAAGIHGRNVLGEILEDSIPDTCFTAGDNVKMECDGDVVRFRSEIFGYAEILGHEINVVSPLWESHDHVDLYFVALAPKAKLKNPTRNDLIDELQRRNVKKGIHDENLISIPKLSGSRLLPECILLACGMPPVHGADARVEYFFNTGNRYGMVREDGSIDFKESGLIPTVGAGQLLACKVAATAGTPGEDIRGNVIQPVPGRDVEFVAGDNVRMQHLDGKDLFYAAIDGRVQIVRDTRLQVNPVVEIKGDIDYSTGNIDFQGDVEIAGSIQSGFQIKAGGSVMVKGIVNPGVIIEARGDVFVGKGIIGRDNTKIVSKGNVSALFYQNAEVQADGDVIYRRYIINSRIRCGGSVLPPEELGDKIQGSIIGGEIIAAREIKAREIGSSASIRTKVTVGVDWPAEQELRRIDEAIDFCQATKKKLLRSSRFLTLTETQILDLLKQIPAAKREIIKREFASLQELQKLDANLQRKREDARQKLHQSVEHANIVVSSMLHANVVVQIGEAQLKIESDAPRVRLFGDQEKKTIRVMKMTKS